MANADIGTDFDGIELAEGSSKLPPLAPGTYELRVDDLKYIKSRTKGNFAIGEYTVNRALGEGANSTGSKASHVIKMSLDSSKANVKNLVAAVMGESEKNVTAANAKEAFSNDQPCRGEVINATAFNITTTAGKPFTVIKYAPTTTTSVTVVPKTGAKSTSK